ncbi:oxidoreductase [Photobacterium aquae]|uniref:Oxidoreductase n=1 Tax=Photobacterium aquae TaxID=1195763 RepID=A0A0J1H6E8_9GAMM|nr:Gfo/Idh/MocA family oxidoreductase [Photobacterium aquae]KLV07318.1 oxidoreductase [Photobacterium aquae]
MKIALIGLGDIAQKAYLPVLMHRMDVEWVLCSRQPKVVELLARQYRISQVATDYRQLPSMGVDAVMVHSATVSHYEIAHYFLNAGIPVFVDKPLCDTYEECDALYDLAEKKKQPLFVGFNRRYIPLYQQHLVGLNSIGAQGEGLEASGLRSLTWEKHRHNLPGHARTFVFDDFIHPLDSVNQPCCVNPQDLYISQQRITGSDGHTLLARLDVQWQQGGILFHASMNRCHGATMESVSANYVNRSYRFDSFCDGIKWEDGVEYRLKQADWTPMLESKGFSAMIEHWLQVVKDGELPLVLAERNLRSHRLAQYILQQLE